jgi:hypothetical protein
MVIGRVLATEPFKFIVGPGKKEFLIHKDIVGRLSATLNTLVNGQMKEAAEGCVVLDDVDEDIFMRFAQFAYTGSYTTFAPTDIPSPAVAPVSRKAGGQKIDGPTDKRHRLEDTAGALGGLDFSNPPTSGDVLSDFDFDSFLHDDGPTTEFDFSGIDLKGASEVGVKETGGKEMVPFKLPYSIASFKTAATDWLNNHCNCKHQKQQKNTSSGWKRKFDQMSCQCPACREWTPKKKKVELIDSFTAQSRGSNQGEAANSGRKSDSSSSATQLLEPVFLGHARVWVFADRYAISSLMDLACSHLVHAMAHWKIFESTFIADFGALTRFVYGNTVARSSLRLVLAHFAACVVEDVSHLKGWPLLLNDEPDFGVDLVNQMTTRF